MHFVQAYSHHNGRDQWRDRELDEWLTDVFERPDLAVGPGSTAAIRDHVKNEFAAEGWAYDVRSTNRSILQFLGSKTISRFIFKQEILVARHTIF
jgi:hypothetical protein